MPKYTKDFFEQRVRGSIASAREILPLVLDLVKPASALDVGCGTGAWLTVLDELGVNDFMGVDGDYIAADDLAVPAARFRALDLAHPFRLQRSFDLVLSLEVAEHLPGEAAAGFVSSLCAHGSVVLFSAAVPWQGGTGHVNEQWPEYWAQLFAQSGFAAADAIRHRIWNNESVDWWYAQNTLLFIAEHRLAEDEALRRAGEETRTMPLSRIHPRSWIAFNRSTEARLQLPAIAADLAPLIGEGESFILVDDDVLGGSPLPGRCAIPFLERDGRYWGPPADSATASGEMERLRAAGAAFIVFSSGARWWLDHYREFAEHLKAHYPCALDNGRLVVFRLATTTSADNAGTDSCTRATSATIVNSGAR
jgi:SAM-dependent methyltransferase